MSPPPAQLERCPDLDERGRNCKRRGCPYCGRLWAWDWERVMHTNLRHYAGAVRMVAITAPGADALPWSGWRRDPKTGRVRPCPPSHAHSGARGCLVESQAANEWSESVTQRWKELREAARKATLDALGLKPTLLLRVWEPQKRGVPHLHVVLGVRTEAEKIAAERFRQELDERASHYGFGFVQRHVHETGPRQAARYLVGYLLGRSKRKTGIRENIADARMPRSLIWLTPDLTIGPLVAGRRTGGTLCTMRRLRYARWYFAAFSGRSSQWPCLRGQVAVDIARVVTLLERQRGRQREDDVPDAAPVADPDRVRFHLRTLQAMRRLQLSYVAHGRPGLVAA